MDSPLVRWSSPLNPKLNQREISHECSRTSALRNSSRDLTQETESVDGTDKRTIHASNRVAGSQNLKGGGRHSPAQNVYQINVAKMYPSWPRSGDLRVSGWPAADRRRHDEGGGRPRRQPHDYCCSKAH